MIKLRLVQALTRQADRPTSACYGQDA